MSTAPSTILIVDDNADNRTVLTRRLERHGYAVENVGSGKEALRLLGVKTVDLILLDVMMRDMDGFETLQRIRDDYSLLQLPVIMVTALAQSSSAVEALQLGANDYVTKPVDFLVVLARIRTHLILKRLADQNDDFLRVTSIDVKRALIQIQGLASDLLDLIAAPATQASRLKQLTEQIADAATKTQARVDHFLQLKAPEQGRSRKQASLNELTRTVISRNLVHARRKGIVIDVELDDAIDPVQMYELRLEQVVENLVDNAIKFSPKGTTTRVCTRLDGDWAVVEVSDQGPGIPQGDIDRIFNKYADAVNHPTGGEASAGVGLSVCKQLVEQYQGEIGVRNNNDQGATFWCRLRAH